MPGTAGPHGPCAIGKKAHGGLAASTGSEPGIPRAVFLGLLRDDPGGHTIFTLHCGRLRADVHATANGRRLHGALRPVAHCR